MEKVIIIAEAGVNHNGDMLLAKKLIDVASEAQADYIKFQTWVTENVMVIGAPKAEYQKLNDSHADQYSMAKKLELSFSQFKELFEYCQLKSIKFLSTPEEVDGLNFLADELKLPLLKVGSGELDNILFLKSVGEKHTDVILSTGMGTLAETRRAYDTLLKSGATSVSILHCTSNYPVDYGNVNLTAIRTLATEFNTVIGYSDHSIGAEVSIAAVALGARIIEKHFTLDKNLPGPDHAASLDPQELKNMVQQIRHIERAMSGSGKKEPQASEQDIKKVIRKGPYLARSLKKGEIISSADLHFKRPVQEISADKAELLLGKSVVNDLPIGHCLCFRDVQDALGDSLTIEVESPEVP
jgi:N,N'-diacetyllegionaminate synthase